jgi:putative hemolysin
LEGCTAGSARFYWRANCCGRRFVVWFGRPIALATRVDVRDGASATTLMRAAVDRLATPAVSAVAQPPVPVLHGPAASALMSDVQALGNDNRLLRSGRFDVFSARAAQIPNLLLEIGRLRELTFRTVGEGTGKAVDLDRFDEHYLHLFVWNHDTREVVGAYRIGAIDGILASHGVNGLYTSTLFRYDQRLLTRLGPALELGRSFVRAEYQRSNALLLLWKGIAQYVAQRQRYRVLFGPVSISSRYRDSSQQLLRSFLAQNAYHRELGELVAALTPPPELPTAAANAPMSGNLRDLDKLIAGQEPDGKGMPVLLRQYLRLNAKLLGFNVDPAFGDALDALMMVDLADVDAAILKRYFGAEEAELLLRTARRSCPEAA